MKAQEAINDLMRDAQAMANRDIKNLTGMDIEPFRASPTSDSQLRFEIDPGAVEALKQANNYEMIDQLSAIAKRSVRAAIRNDGERFMGIIIAYAKTGRDFPNLLSHS